ncbi:unnamed protein product [Moneuplotes crassus]|uniref:RING-type domain-containing protein n=1 Tax=Euplotes crassus TaxID=5936 RepID=A0AAD1XH90_EUPCR|nr:unnamed protein product [Moneuplotes crassus]
MECTICFREYSSCGNNNKLINGKRTSQYEDTKVIPKILTECGHTYCSYCLGQVAQNNCIYCPLCHERNYIIKVMDLPTNFALLQAVEGWKDTIQELEKIKKETGHFCEQKDLDRSWRKLEKDLQPAALNNQDQYASGIIQQKGDLENHQYAFEEIKPKNYLFKEETISDSMPEEEEKAGCFSHAFRDDPQSILPPLKEESKDISLSSESFESQKRNRVASLLHNNESNRMSENICKFCDFNNKEGFVRCTYCRKPKSMRNREAARRIENDREIASPINMIRGSIPPSDEIRTLLDHDNRIWYCRYCCIVNKFKKICTQCRTSKEEADYRFAYFQY